LWLGPRDGGLIGVGVVGSYDALAPLIAKYRGDAVQIYFPYPRSLAINPKGNTFMRMLVNCLQSGRSCTCRGRERGESGRAEMK
jgi:hypothetical protein